MELKTPLNRFDLIHWNIPIRMSGAFTPSGLNIVVSRFDHGMSYLSTRAIFLLYQFMKSDVSRLKQR